MKLIYDKDLKKYIEKINVTSDILARYRIKEDLYLHILEILRYEGRAQLTTDEDALSYSSHKALMKMEKVTDCSEAMSLESRLKSEDLCTMELRVASEYFEHGNIENGLKSVRILETLKNSGFYSIKLGRYFRLKAMEAVFTGQATYILSYYRKSLNEALKEDDHICVALTYMGLGNYYSISRNFKEAVVNYEKAILEFNEVDDKLGVARVKENLAYALYQLNDYWNATKINDEAIDLLKKLKNNAFLQYAYLNRAIAFKEEGIYEGALENFYLVNAISKTTGNDFLTHLTNVWITLCKIILKERDIDFREFIDAYQHLSDVGDIGYIISCKTVKCVYHISRNEKNEFFDELMSILDVILPNTPLYQSDLISSMVLILKAMSIFRSDLKVVSQFFDKVSLILNNETANKEFSQIARRIFPL